MFEINYLLLKTEIALFYFYLRVFFSADCQGIVIILNKFGRKVFALFTGSNYEKYCIDLINILKTSKKNSSLDGFEPSTFRLTAERANQLRHRDLFCPLKESDFKLTKTIIKREMSWIAFY